MSPAQEQCNIVAERVALGEPLGDVADHAARCARCRRLAALPAELGEIHRDVDPGLGFSARMTMGAQQRIRARRRMRVAGGLAATLAAAAAGLFIVTRTPPEVRTAGTPPPPAETRPAASQHDNPAPNKDPWRDRDAPDPDVAALVDLARVERATHISAHWDRIEKPLAPYRVFAKGVTSP
jgi:hypothetical protein